MFSWRYFHSALLIIWSSSVDRFTGSPSSTLSWWSSSSLAWYRWYWCERWERTTPSTPAKRTILRLWWLSVLTAWTCRQFIGCSWPWQPEICIDVSLRKGMWMKNQGGSSSMATSSGLHRVWLCSPLLSARGLNWPCSSSSSSCWQSLGPYTSGMWIKELRFLVYYSSQLFSYGFRYVWWCCQSNWFNYINYTNKALNMKF